jgi:hypothetical protein
LREAPSRQKRACVLFRVRFKPGTGVAVRGRPQGWSEALTGAHAGRVSSCETIATGVPTSFCMAEGNTGGCASASIRRTARSLRPQACMETPRARTGRSHRRPSWKMLRRAGWRRPLHGRTRQPTIVIGGLDHTPDLTRLALDERLARLALRVQRVEALLRQRVFAC